MTSTNDQGWLAIWSEWRDSNPRPLVPQSQDRPRPEADRKPARGIEKFPERSHELFLTSDELARLGDVLRQGETVGLPYAIDENSPKAKHAPKEDNPASCWTLSRSRRSAY
jgi:hypothetical protein